MDPKITSSDQGPVLDEEPGNQVPGSFLSAMPQFFVFPLILVATLTAAYLGLRLLVGSEPTDARELLADVRAAPGEHARWQALHSLADGLRRGRLTLDEVSAGELASLYEDHAADSPRMTQFLLEVLQWKRSPELTRLAEGALADSSPEVRLAALFALAQMQDPASVPALIERLGEGAADERWIAMGGLARIATPEALDAVAGLLGGEDSILHRNAVLGLAQAGDGRAADYLPGLLRRENYEGDGRLDDPDATARDEQSRQAARDGVIEQFLVNACRAAARLNDMRVVPQLQVLREDDPSVKVRSAAINALYDLGAGEESS